MKCQLRGYNLKTFAKGVRLIGKLSEDVLIIADNNRLKLQAIHEFKTVFVELQFERQFFSAYECDTETKCKLFMKSLILVFRMLNIDKVVNTCTMIMDGTNPKVIFEMSCRNEVKREYFLPYMATQLRYTSSLSQTNPSFKVKANLMSECLQNFANETKDITIWLKAQGVLFKSYCEEAEDKGLVTSFSYNSREFKDYHINHDITVTFNLKDLKAFVDFAGIGDQTIWSYFEASGRPIEFTFNVNGFYSARLLLATHDFPDDEYPSQPDVPSNTPHLSASLVSSGDISLQTPNGSGGDGGHNTNGLIIRANAERDRDFDDPFDDPFGDPFDEEGNQFIETAISQQVNGSPLVSASEVQRMTASQLRLYHNSTMFPSDDEDNHSSSDEVLVPETDDED